MPRVPKGKIQLSVLISEDLYKRLWDHIKSKYSGSTYGLLSIEVQNAIAHWLAEQEAQGEGRAHTKARKLNPGVPRIQAKVDEIVRWLRSRGYLNQFTLRDWELACAHTVGSDRRTIEKYLRFAERLGRVKNVAGVVWEMI